MTVPKGLSGWKMQARKWDTGRKSAVMGDEEKVGAWCGIRYNGVWREGREEESHEVPGVQRTFRVYLT